MRKHLRVNMFSISIVVPEGRVFEAWRENPASSPATQNDEVETELIEMSRGCSSAITSHLVTCLIEHCFF